jgi:hypothetical protein
VIAIEPTRRELEDAVCGGARRQLQALVEDRGHHFESRDSWENHVLGAVAEMVLARHLGRYWYPVYDEPQSVAADLGDNVQIRCGPKRDHPLIVRAWDRDAGKLDHYYVLVLVYELKPGFKLDGRPPRFYVAGYAKGGDVIEHGRYWPASAGKPEAWSLAQSELAQFREAA